jgi:hypothetical protein
MVEGKDGSSEGSRRSGKASWVPFAGMVRDVRARAPYYLSDWTDAWNYRVVPSTLVS